MRRIRRTGGRPAVVRLALGGVLAAALAAGCSDEEPVSRPPATTEWVAPGLVDREGGRYVVPTPAPGSGTTLDVTDFGADPGPGPVDDAEAVRAAVEAAGPGDQVTLPAGVYDLRSTDPDDDTANVVLPSGVRLRGAGADETVLRTWFDGQDDSAVLRASGVRDVVISDLTITSTYDGELGSDPEDGDAGGGPMYGVQIGARDGRGSARVLVDRVSVSRFQRHGITVKASRDVTVRSCHVADATSVGPGGAGYGIAIEGRPDRRDPGADDDARHNVVVDNTLDGAHLRHGILLQFPTHNNLVADNLIEGSILDAIDLHGEGEYLNEIRGNVVTGGDRAAIALGNSGGEENAHDAAGAGNWVHHNVLTGNEVGVLVILGTPDTLIEDNEILAHEESEAGVELLNAPGTIVRGNSFVGGDEDYWAIELAWDAGADGRGAGAPRDVLIEGNTLSHSSNGMRVDAGDRIVISHNEFHAISGLETRIADGADVRED
jgi:hypothetical protein